MEELVRTNDPVLLSWLAAQFAEENIDAANRRCLRFLR